MIDDIKTRAALISAAADFLTGFESINTTEGSIDNLPIMPADAISWENKFFDPASKAIWSSVYYRPNDPETRTLGPGGFDEVTGFMQIDFNSALDVGEADFIAWKHKARLFFHGGRYFTHEKHSVIVTSCGMSQGRVVDNYFRQSLTVAFRSHLKRPKLIN